MSDYTPSIDLYLEAYGEADEARRRQLISQVWAADGQLIDPPLDAAGHAAINDMAAAVQGQFAGHTFRRSTAVDEHHGFARYGWDLVAPDGSVTLSGVDVAQFGDDGKLVRVTGFFGDLVPAAA